MKPTMRSTISPSLNRIMVGMPLTLKCIGVCWFSSTFSLTILIRPACSTAICSSTGATMRHGPHHSAQKSTRTGVSPLVSASKTASVMCVSCPTLDNPPRMAGAGATTRCWVTRGLLLLQTRIVRRLFHAAPRAGRPRLSRADPRPYTLHRRPEWRNWQTRYVQGVVGVFPSGFESLLRHLRLGARQLFERGPDHDVTRASHIRMAYALGDVHCCHAHQGAERGPGAHG